MCWKRPSSPSRRAGHPGIADRRRPPIRKPLSRRHAGHRRRIDRFLPVQARFLDLDNLLGGLGTGLLVVAAWYVSGHVGYLAEHPETLEEAFLATNSGRMESLTFVAPQAYTLELLMLWSDTSRKLTFAIATVLGVIAGSCAWSLVTRASAGKALPASGHRQPPDRRGADGLWWRRRHGLYRRSGHHRLFDAGARLHRHLPRHCRRSHGDAEVPVLAADARGIGGSRLESSAQQHTEENMPKAQFCWEDPLLLDAQLSSEERQIRDAARDYCQGKLMPRGHRGLPP